MRINQLCVGCGHCKAFCPVDAIDTCGVSSINEKCIECGKCIGYCALGAIAEEERP